MESVSGGGGGAPFPPYAAPCPLWAGPWDITSIANDAVLEDEMFVTGRCETVAVRFGILMFNIALVAITALFALTMYVRTLLGGGLARWNMRMTILTLATAGPWLRLILLFLGLFYKLNVAYHILLALPLCCTFASLSGVVAQWLIVIAATNKLSHNKVLKQRLYYAWLIGNIVCTIVLTVLWGTASAFRYGELQNVATLNWLFALGFLWLALQATALGVCIHVTGRKLLRQLHRTVAAAGDAESTLSKAAERVRTFSMMMASNSAGASLTCLAVFIWFLATRNTPFGMGYFFYVLLLGFVPMEAAGVYLVFFVYRRASKPVTDSGSGSTSEPQKRKPSSAGANSTTDSQGVTMGSVSVEV